MLTPTDITRAQQRIAAHLQPTLLEAAPGLGERIWLKLENLNPTHSFKIRGALNAVLSLDDAARERGIIAASSGNHAQALAYAARITGTPAAILMPIHTPRRKVRGVEQNGAQAVLTGDNYDQTEAEALRRARDEGLVYISPYNHPHVVAGAGTIGLEIVDALPGVERVVVPVSGGGLISGVALAVKEHRPSVEIVGVNALSAPAMYNTFYNARHPQMWETLAEALSGDIEAGSITIELAKRYVDTIALVDETQITEAIRWMVDEQGWLVEGGGAVGIAALLGGVIPADGRQTVIVVSGGNIDGDTLRRVLA
jgi:threonine dehydratase